MYYIYALQDPRDLSFNPRYIGYTNNLRARFFKHISSSSLAPINHKNNWIKSLLNLNIKPVMVLIESNINNIEQAYIQEKFYIKFFKDAGFDLTNANSGGMGGPTITGRKMSEEQKMKISATLKNRFFSEEHRILLGIATKRRWADPVYKEMMSKKLSGHSFNVGFKHSPESNAKKSLKLKGVPQLQVICPYCQKSGGVSGMKRYHFDHCRFKE